MFKPTIYIQISPDRLTLRNVKSGETLSEIPEMAISPPPKQKILGVGDQARGAAAATPGAVLVNPFAHPRSLVSDFTVAEQLVKAFLHRMRGNSWFAAAPMVVMHPLGDPAGGFTQVENRAFREMALGAGASQAIVWQGTPLTNAQILSGEFPSTGLRAE